MRTQPPYESLRDFVAMLKREGELVEVRTPVDPALEAGEISMRVVREGGPALLFRNPAGAAFPLLTNLFGTRRRIELAIGEPPAALGARLLEFLEALQPPTIKALIARRKLGMRLLAARTRVASENQDFVYEDPDLARLPILTCWPEDGGRFVTFPLVLTHHPHTGRRNLGIYRMHVFDRTTTGMHWQIEKGGGFHYAAAEREGRSLPVAVIVGADPAVMLSAVFPLPENVDELAFAAFLRGKPLKLAKSPSFPHPYPLEAELVLEGEVAPRERRMEGPFGDHFGHYSGAAEFPVFRVNRVRRRRDAVFVATIVGKPPQEDKYLGMAVNEMMAPLVRLVHPEVSDLWAYPGAGFHNLAAVAVGERYHKEAIKTALGLMGQGQMSLTKCLVLVGEGVNVRSFAALLREMRQYFDPARDFILLKTTPYDTLDFSSFEMNLGSKMIVDATPGPKVSVNGVAPAAFPGAIEQRYIEDMLLVVKVRDRDAAVAALPGYLKSGRGTARIVALVGTDTDLAEEENLLWGIFTRFEPARDVYFEEIEMRGVAPVYRGGMGIDATWKPGYPKPLSMDDEIVRKVDRRWNEYGIESRTRR